MSFRRSLILVATLVFSLALNAYLFVLQIFHSGKHSVALTNECQDEGQQAASENPNKSLFVSCSGFLE